jgi:hypothetical protein
MKWILVLSLFLILFTSCSEEKNTDLEAYNTEVYVFDIGDEYEVNVSLRLKGFKIEEEGSELKSSFLYETDLIKPDGSREEGFISKTEDVLFTEHVGDTGLDIQFNLDGNFEPGEYTLVINLRDNYTGSQTKTETEFRLND